MFCGMSSDSPVSFSLSRDFMDTSRSTSLSECFLDPGYDCYLEVAIWNVLGLLGKNSPEAKLLARSFHRFNIFLRYCFFFFFLINYTYIIYIHNMCRNEFQLG